MVKTLTFGILKVMLAALLASVFTYAFAVFAVFLELIGTGIIMMKSEMLLVWVISWWALIVLMFRCNCNTLSS